VDAQVPDAYPLLTELVRVPSVTGSAAEHELQDRLRRQLTSAGLDVRAWSTPVVELSRLPGFPGVEVPRDEVHGVVATLRGSGGGSSVMFVAHVDVVPPGPPHAWSDRDPWSARLRGDLLVGRGSCDMKGGLVAAVLALRALARSGVPLRGDVLLACVEGEEDGGIGTFDTLTRGRLADACIVPEPTGLDVVPAAAGALTFRLTVTGLATHASRRTAGVSAVEKFWPVFAALRDLERRRNAEVDPLVGRWQVPYPVEVGRVEAGDWPSTVPGLLVADGRLGVVLDEPVETARAALEATVAAACASDPWLRDHPVEVQWWGGQFASGRTPTTHPVVRAVHVAHADAVGRRATTWAAPYGSDLRQLVAAGIPTVHYGPGDVTLAHGPDEAVDLHEVVTAARTMALFAVGWSG
jgi:acetylornithine deacetylase